MITARDMAQININIRTDEKLKKQFESLCNDFGLTMSTAMNVFMKTVVREKRIPFEIKLNNQEILEKLTKNIEECTDEESDEIMNTLNSMTRDDLEIVETEKVDF